MNVEELEKLVDGKTRCLLFNHHHKICAIALIAVNSMRVR